MVVSGAQSLGSALHEATELSDRATERSEVNFVAIGQGVAWIVSSEMRACVVAGGLDSPCGLTVNRWVLVVRIVKG